MEKDNLMKNLTNTTVKKIEENLFTDKQKSQKEKKKKKKGAAAQLIGRKPFVVFSASTQIYSSTKKRV